MCKLKNVWSAVFLFFVLSFSFNSIFAQVITTLPAFPIDKDSVTIIFDAAQGNAELKDVSPPIYAHTGVITDQSTGPGDWKYVVAGWTQNLPKAQMTPLGNNIYQLKMKPSIRGYYGVPSVEKILKMAFVFRNSDGSKVGRNADGGDIFADVYPAVTSVNIVLPSQKELYLRQDDTISVSAVSPLADTMKLYQQQHLIRTTAGQFITDTILADSFGQNWIKRWIKVLAENDTASAADSFSYTVIPASPIAVLPTGIIDGINYLDDHSVILCLYAPGKTNAFVLGDFNDWKVDSSHYMNQTPDGKRFWLQINDLIPKKEYIFQYLVDGSIQVGDPYADKVSDWNDAYISASTYPGLLPYPSGKASGVATYLQTAQDPYPWNSSSFTAPDVTDLVIYELLIRDFTASHDYPSLIDTLDYLKHLGVNAIELMPIMEFEGNISWGYNPDFSFAVDKYYGTKNGLKQFVEAAHAKGIAVILDIVCNHHFGQSPLVQLYWDGSAQRPSADNPWFNQIPKHPYNVGYDFNHESTATKAYMERLVKYWIQEYHVDGYRFDLSKGFTQRNSYPDNVSLWGQYDASRISILKNYCNVIHSVKPEAYVILEHFADNSEETELAANNMLLWGNMNGPYGQGAMGYNANNTSDFSWASYKKRGWTQPNLVAYMESHDEERVMFRTITYGNATNPPYNPKDTTTALKRVELDANFFFTIPGPKMIWQFGELGYDYSINYPSGTSDSRLSPKPIRWDYYHQWKRHYTEQVFAALIDLKKKQSAFKTTDFSLDLTTAVKRLYLRHASMDVTVLGNFDIADRNVVPNFTKTGMWYEFYTGDSLNVISPVDPLPFKAGEYRLYTSVRLPKPIFTGIEDLPSEFQKNKIMRVYPNPSNGIFHFQFELLKPGYTDLTVYNMYGKTVAVVCHENLGSGSHKIDWNCQDGISGKPAPGIYFYRLNSGPQEESGKIILQNAWTP